MATQDQTIDPYTAFREGKITYGTFRELKRQLDEKPKNRLCTICQGIDFKRLYAGQRLSDADRAAAGVVLGTYYDIETRGLTCVICRWICHNVNYNGRKDRGLLIKLCCDGSTVYDGRETSMRNVNGFLVPIVRLRVSPYRLEEDIIADLRLVVKPKEDAEWPDVLTGKFVDRKTTTIKQFELWMKDCVGAHEHTDDHLPKHRLEELYSETLNSVPGLRLIDVASRKLVTTAALKRVDGAYVALSYVWGPNPPPVVLGPDNTLPDHLPATIEDALTMVKALEYIPFLWVDAICIPQDDPVVRQEQIKKMDVIYDRAMAALIATGPSVTTGITGISVKNNPAHSIQVGPLLIQYQACQGLWKILMTGFNDAADHFTPWGHRGWTFQEALVARRRLIFNAEKDRIMFECSSGSRQTHPTDVWEQVKAAFFNDIDRIRRKEMHDWNMHWWQHLLNLYLKRTLTYEQDILGAWIGVGKVIARTVELKEGEGGVCWGIPRKEFLAGLMWAPLKSSKSMEERTCKLDDGREIPSWHWGKVRSPDGIGFVEGSEPLQLLRALRWTWLGIWDEVEWNEVERTGKIPWRGGIVDYGNSRSSHDALGFVENASTIEEAFGLDLDSLTTPMEKLKLTRKKEAERQGEAKGIDSRQCAMQAWRDMKGCFISCDAWAWAGTLDEVKEPLAMYPYAHRLGNPKPMAPNRQFILMVEWCGWEERRRRQSGVESEDVPHNTHGDLGYAGYHGLAAAPRPRSRSRSRSPARRMCKRVGWAVVDMAEWQEREERNQEFLLI
jgi:hypothetical protein